MNQNQNYLIDYQFSKDEYLLEDSNPYTQSQQEEQKTTFNDSLKSPNQFQQQSKQQINCYVYAWGKNEYGELSFSQTKQQFYSKPENPKNLEKIYIKQISTSQNHSSCVSSNGDLYVCGSALHGKLGLENLTMANINKFQILTALKGIKVLQVACGDYHTLALTENDQVYAWGGTLYKKVGQRGGKPGPIHQLTNKGVTYIDCGDFHSVAITNQGDIYTWGGGGQFQNKGQLGLGHMKDIEIPEQIQFFKNKKVIKVSCGQFHTMALIDDNQLYGWGAGELGELGSGKVLYFLYLLIILILKKYITINKNNYYKKDPQISDIKCGGHHTLILLNIGYVYSTGYGSYGQLGLKTTNNHCEFQLVWTLTKKKIIKIAAGWNHSLVLTDTNDVFSCGYNAWGQLGLGDEESRTLFTHISALAGKNVVEISAGGSHSWAILEQQFPEKPGNYRYPSPLRQIDQNQIIQGKSRYTSPDTSALKDVQKKENVDNIKKGPQFEFEKILQVIYTEVDMCHRFIRFDLLDNNKQNLNNLLQEYMNELKQYEGNCILYSKYQQDEAIFDENNNQINANKECLNKSFTFMIISDPFKNKEFQENNTNFINTNCHMKSLSIGDSILIKESDLIGKNEKEVKLCYWFTLFVQMFKSLTSRMKFIELRPQSFIKQ
ncbi:hypothetical protein IMG5_058940 [Ichthyophthirius multifiliis]|uniref:RCC1-like domain-containing protein n=1 Tax=Ichthyophthirius multifiliis TaxID=5932 RepID=G0QNI4_ICHMU|nr:hypothetical protein IMG5_058940 [Ichthyophthirius multifiliis]EGR33218.1 hypothetical protein IMG5_058940 [Ichthyophthirius multifiliis]|eukprot:XP_004037204.1 hypothetical protein IMG5_058940 [Ichthyophthirius multifiliis]